MPKTMDDGVIVSDKIKSAQFAGAALVIDVHDPDRVLGQIATLCFTRESRNPAKLLRYVKLDERGRGRFYGWTPAGLGEVFILIEGNASFSRRRPWAAIRKASMIEVGARAGFKSPWAMLQAVQLLIAKNWRGFRYRFGRLYDDLNEPDYKIWLETTRQDSVSPYVPGERSNGPPVLVSIIGDAAQAEATRRSLMKQSYTNVHESPVDLVEAAAATFQEPCLWMPIAAGDKLDNQAIAKLVQPLLADPNSAAIYCDEDQIDAHGRRFAPFFYPGWNPPLAETGWLAPAGAVFRLNGLGGGADLTKQPVSQLLLKAAKTGQVIHVPLILVHRLLPRTPAVASSLKIRRSKTNVSVIIPTRDRAALLRACLKGLFEATRYDDLDVIIIDNDSREPETHALFSEYEARGSINRIVQHGSFNFSSACNLGAANARHDLILLLNNDVEPLGAQWLDQLVAELDEPEIGAVGALLLFPDGFVQHAGITLGAGSVARHTFQFRHPGTGEDLGLLNQRQEMSAVTAACLLTRRTLWNEVDGMDERQLTVAFNDVDYCLKLREIGKRVMWTPHARLMHRESVSRGRDDTPEKLARFATEEGCMHDRWGARLKNDPFYNPNLSLVAGDHTLDIQPRDLAARNGTLLPREIQR